MQGPPTPPSSPRGCRLSGSVCPVCSVA